jgi:hypothetical protein
MRPSRLCIVAAVAIVLAWGRLGAQQAPENAAGAAAAGEAVQAGSEIDLGPIAEAIRTAADPVAAADAYARGFAVDPNNFPLHKAYLARMLEADLPEMAYDSARVVAAAEADHDVAWSVLAHQHIRRGQAAQAAAALVRAAGIVKENAFAQAVAGEVVGTMAARAEAVSLPRSVRDGIKAVQLAVANTDPYRRAYRKARRTAPRSAKADEDRPPKSPPTEAADGEGRAAEPAEADTQPPAPEAGPTVEDVLAEADALLVESRLSGMEAGISASAATLASSISRRARRPRRPSYATAGYYEYSTGPRLGGCGFLPATTYYGRSTFLSGYGISLLGVFDDGEAAVVIATATPRSHLLVGQLPEFPVGAVTHGRYFRGFADRTFTRRGITGSLPRGRTLPGAGTDSVWSTGVPHGPIPFPKHANGPSDGGHWNRFNP